jgi:hypothetical protein
VEKLKQTHLSKINTKYTHMKRSTESSVKGVGNVEKESEGREI